MSKQCKVRSKKISALPLIAIVFIITMPVIAQYKGHKSALQIHPATVDSPPPAKRTKIINTANKKNPATPADSAGAFSDTTINDSLARATDTLNVKLSKDSLSAPVIYAAQDSGVLIIPTKQFILYGKADVKYTDVQITGAYIGLDQQKQIITSYGSTDTTGNPLNKPKLVQGDMQSTSDTIRYNTRSQKGLTQSTYLQQGEMYVHANTIKKINENTAYAWRARFTTCNLDTPHFAFRTRKMKMISNKIGVSGPAFPEFEGVPVPIGIPFGIYPLNRGRHSGFLPPQFAASDQTGLGLEGLGFYKVLSDNFDATVRGNIYSYGGWTLNVSSMYLKRYKYNGRLNIAIQNTKYLNTGSYAKEEFTKSKTFMVNWSHSRDTKARPGSTFSASVNAGSTRFNNYVTTNALQNFQNSLSSSINYTKDWGGKYNLSISANHSQNGNSRLVNLNLPTASFNVLTIYPFQRKEAVGTPKWYEKLGFGYTGNFQNEFSFYDSAFSFRKLVDTAQYGASHVIPITLSLPQLGPLQLAPSVSYEERWYGQKFIQTWRDTKKRVDTSISRGLYAARQMQFGMSASTRVFGTYQFAKTSKIQAIRHEIRPSVSVNYRPDMQKGSYHNVQYDSIAIYNRRYSQYQGAFGTPFSEGRFGGIGFTLDNTLEMKVRDLKDTSEGGTKKIRILENFGFSGAYNLIPQKNDSFPLSNISFRAASTLFEKINITASANLDPYKVDDSGLRRSKLMLKDNIFKPGRITDAGIAISTSFQSKSKDGKTDKERLPQDDYMTPDEQQRQLDYVRSNPAEYTDFNIPWSVQLSYSLRYSKRYGVNRTALSTTYSNISINGDFSLTPRWKMGGNTYFDFTTGKIQTLTMFITREMHCWQLAINLTPVGPFRSFNVTINPKSGILRDLKVNRSRFFYQ